MFSAAQRRTIRNQAGQWLEQAGLEPPEVVLDTGHAVWAGTDLRLTATLEPGVGREFTLTVPVSRQGRPDFGGAEALARKMAQAWAAQRSFVATARVRAKIKAGLEEQARDYVTWLLEQHRDVTSTFLDEMNRILDDELIKAKNLCDECEKDKKGLMVPEGPALKVELKQEDNGSGFLFHLKDSAIKIYTGLVNAYKPIADGMAELPGNMCREISAHAEEIARGLLFAIVAAGYVIIETAWIVIKDVCAAALTFLIGRLAAKVMSKVTRGGKIYRLAKSRKKSFESLSAEQEVAISISMTVYMYHDSMDNLARKACAMGETIDWLCAKIIGDKT